MDKSVKRPVIVNMRPMLYTDTKGQKWAISGQHWLPVPDTETLDTISDVMVYEPYKSTPKLSEVKTWSVQGSKGDTYTVTYNGHAWSCTCAGFGWRRKCRHVTEKMHANR